MPHSGRSTTYMWHSWRLVAGDRELPERRPAVLRDLEVDDPRGFSQVVRQHFLRVAEMVGPHMRGAGVTVPERFDEHVFRGVVEAARPVEPEIARLGPGRRGEVGGDVRPPVRMFGEDPEPGGNKDHHAPRSTCWRAV